MKCSLIINTACMDPIVFSANNPWRQLPYGARKAHVLKMLDECVEFDEIVVAGVFEPDAGDCEYTYVEVAPLYRDRRDALLQRETGARQSTGDILVFTHDDHMPAFAQPELEQVEQPWDILVPRRVHGVTGDELNNGGPRFSDPPYMGGHTLVMRREVWVRVPWVRALPFRCWDLHMTRIWRDAGFTITHTDELVSIDLEAGADES